MKKSLALLVLLAACSSTRAPVPPAAPAAPETEVIVLQYTSASEIAALLHELVPSAQRIEALPSTNSLVVCADAASLPKLRELIARLDVPPQAPAAR